MRRHEFETWFSDGDPNCRGIERSGEGYKFMVAHQAWKVWKAATAKAADTCEAIADGHVWDDDASFCDGVSYGSNKCADALRGGCDEA